MNDSWKSNRLLLVAVALICIIPFFAAWLSYKNSEWVTRSTTNYGELISPAVKIERTSFIGLDDFSTKHADEIKGRWVMMQLISIDSDVVDRADLLHKTRQIRLMLNKDLMRVRRIVVVSHNIAKNMAESWWSDDATVLRFKPRTLLFDQLSGIIGQPLEPGMLFLMDPLGNLMMWYKPGYDPYGVAKDMTNLLRVSQIG